MPYLQSSHLFYKKHPKRDREPIFNLPRILLLLVGVLISLHLWVEYGMNDWQRIAFFWEFSFRPLEFYNFHITGDPKFGGVIQVILTYILPFMGEGGWEWDRFGLNMMRLVSYSFLHGDWTHLGLNLIWLVIFGAPLCRCLGAVRFLFFWVFMAALSALTHFTFQPHSPIPMIGASGVVSALMGVATRYGFYRDEAGHESRRLLPMHQALMNKSAFFFISIWLITNLAVGFGAAMPGMEEANIAWEAHIGGLVAGFVLIGLFKGRKN